MPLTLDPNWQDGDAFFEALVAAHEGLSGEESHAFNARLILILANHVADTEALAQALDLAASEVD